MITLALWLLAALIGAWFLAVALTSMYAMASALVFGFYQLFAGTLGKPRRH